MGSPQVLLRGSSDRYTSRFSPTSPTFFEDGAELEFFLAETGAAADGEMALSWNRASTSGDPLLARREGRLSSP